MPRRFVAWSESVLLFAALYVGLPWAMRWVDAQLGWPAFPSELQWIGLAMLVLGAFGIAWCFLLFDRRGHGTPNPIVPPSELVTSGPFAWTRNPIILSHALASLGVALIIESPTMVLVVLGIGVPVYFVARHEEKTLEHRFGVAYVRYRNAVPRWIPRPPRRQS